MTQRVGIGFDVHAHCDDAGRVLVLGGVAFPDARPLAGHSDADVLCHALADALLGAAGLGDLGERFGEVDPAYEGAASVDLVRAVASDVAVAGWRLANADIVVALEAPKLAPMRAHMQEVLSAAAGGPVSVKASTTEGLGAIGRGEGIAAWAVALLHRDGDAGH